LTFEVPLGGFGTHTLVEATVSVDGETLDVFPVMSGDPLLGDYLAFPDAYPTAGAVGGHWVQVTATFQVNAAIDITQRIVVRPAMGRPAQEDDTRWRIERTACCNVKYLSDSAAGRDLAELVAVIDASAERVEEHFGLELPRVRFVLIDTLWGNGGYAGGEVVVSYLDRDYSPGRRSTFQQTVLHELAHAVTDQLEFSTPWPLIEGVAVQFTQGHFKPEPLGARAKALSELGLLPSLEVLFDTFPDMQHETRYAAVGVFTEYLVQEYGFERLLDMFDSRLRVAGSEWLGAAAAEALDVDLEGLQTGFLEWVESHDAGSQAQDLELTIALQEARRAYQAAHAPYPNYFLYPSVTATGQDALAMRDARSPRLVAVEAFIGYAQDLIIAGDLNAAAAAVDELERIVTEGTVGSGLSEDFLGVAEAVAAAGYELIEYRPGEDRMIVLATDRAPALSLLSLTKQAGEWRVTSAAPAPESTTALGM